MTTLPKDKHALVIQGSEEEKKQACIEIRDWAVKNGIPIAGIYSVNYKIFNIPNWGGYELETYANNLSDEKLITLGYTIHHTVESFMKVFEVEDTPTSLPIEFIEWYSGMTRDKIMRAFERWKRESTIQKLNPIEPTNPKN